MSRFQRHAEVIASALALCERMYQGSLGADISEAEISRIAREPLAVLSDMVDVLTAAAATLQQEAAPAAQA